MKSQSASKQLILVIVKTFAAAWALSGDSLSLMLNGYTMEVPGFKYLFTLLESIDGWGLQNVILLCSLGAVFWLVRDWQRCLPVTLLSIFFAVCTVFGISYSQSGSWDLIFLFGIQFLLAVWVGVGYYMIFKNLILLGMLCLDRYRDKLLRSTGGRVSQLVFERRPFLGPLALCLLLGLPWMIAFCPGTLQWDAHAQLWMSLGVTEQTGYHPVFWSDLMAGCIRLGRWLFGSDSIGMFFFIFPQYLIQSLVFAYALLVMARLRAPVLLRWCTVAFWTVFPYFPMWGVTMVKDTPYYIGVLLMVTAWIDLVSGQEPGGKAAGKSFLLIGSAVLVCLTRNDGRYVVGAAMICALICRRKYWKTFIGAAAACVLLLVLEEGVYMPMNGISQGPAGEALSVPLLQTARYFRDHYEDVTEEELTVIQEGFTIDATELESLYNGECSDGIKAYFTDYPSTDYLKRYFQVWFCQFLRHPDTYIQALLDHIYGYFYPDVHNYGDYLTVTYIGNSEHWTDGYLDLQFTITNSMARDILRSWLSIWEKIPGLSLLYSCGFYTWCLIGTAVALLAHGKRRELAVLAPLVCVLLICMVSPVNGYLRYSMPIMVTLPVQIMWGWASINGIRGEEA